MKIVSGREKAAAQKCEIFSLLEVHSIGNNCLKCFLIAK